MGRNPVGVENDANDGPKAARFSQPLLGVVTQSLWDWGTAVQRRFFAAGMRDKYRKRIRVGSAVAGRRFTPLFMRWLTHNGTRFSRNGLRDGLHGTQRHVAQRRVNDRQPAANF